ncbi:MAG: hypothetical protein ACRC9N_04585, partial [Aeromonas sp.]
IPQKASDGAFLLSNRLNDVHRPVSERHDIRSLSILKMPSKTYLATLTQPWLNLQLNISLNMPLYMSLNRR